MDKGEPEKIADRPLFSHEERRKIVQRFIEAYTDGRVKISYPKGTELASKNHFGALVEAACKIRTGSLNEKDPYTKSLLELTAESAVDRLFILIIAAQQGDRIEGNFSPQSPILETRIDRLEETMTKVTTALKGIKQWMEKYQPTLEEAEKDYSDKLRRVGEVERNE